MTSLSGELGGMFVPVFLSQQRTLRELHGRDLDYLCIRCDDLRAS